MEVNYLLAFIAAMAVSMVIIPIMVRLAPQLGMIDLPDPRKVHTTPVPRAGGVGIVIGALLPVLLWVPVDEAIKSYLLGSFVLLFFGTWDDVKELGHFVKFIGQFIAVLIVVYYGHVYVSVLPFMNLEAVPGYIGKPFTVIAMVGMINAINHSDGLDGLAGGESLLSLVSIAYLAYMNDGIAVTTIALATIGGVFGFLRFNSHPARVFMGDGGSQFLGFTLGYLTVLLTQRVNPALSPALPCLILGLPIIDILAVFAQRAYHGMNWFRASKNHIHHRLLELGFDHYEAVVIIYSIQALLVISAVVLRYDSDAVIVAVYIGVCALLFLFLIVAEKSNWRSHKSHNPSRLLDFINTVKRHRLLVDGPAMFLMAAVPAFLVLGQLLTKSVPKDFGVAAVFMFLVVFIGLIYKKISWLYLRAIIYATLAFQVYLLESYPIYDMAHMGVISYVFFGAVALAVVLAVRYSTHDAFRLTPTDFLVTMLVVLMGFFPSDHATPAPAFGGIVIKIIILFYASEYIIARIKGRWNILGIATLACLAMIAGRGLAG